MRALLDRHPYIVVLGRELFDDLGSVGSLPDERPSALGTISRRNSTPSASEIRTIVPQLGSR
jgi:hypothetical protein